MNPVNDVRQKTYAAARLGVEQAASRLRDTLPPLSRALDLAAWNWDSFYDPGAAVAPVLAEAEDVLTHWIEVVGTKTTPPQAALVAVRHAATMVRALRVLDEQLDSEEALSVSERSGNNG